MWRKCLSPARRHLQRERACKAREGRAGGRREEGGPRFPQVMLIQNKGEFSLNPTLRDLVNREPITQRPLRCDPPGRQRASQSLCHRSLCSFFSSVPLSQGAIILSKLAPEHAVNLDLLSLQGLPCFLCSK